MIKSQRELSEDAGAGHGLPAGAAARELTAGPTLGQLRALVAVADTLHFGDAAAELGLSQPAVSAAVATLERVFGTALVERTTRRVLLTATGALVAERARRVLSDVDDLSFVASRGADPLAGPLRLGVIPSIAPYLLPSVVGGLVAALPGLQLDVTEDQTARLLLALSRGHLDAAIIATEEDPRAVTDHLLYHEDFVLAVTAGSPLAGTSDIDRAMLPELDLMVLADGHCLRDQVLDLCPTAGRPGAGNGAHATSLATLTQLVAHGFGSTLLPATTVALHQAQATAGSPGLGIATLAAPVPGRTVRLVHRTGAVRGPGFLKLAEVIRDLVAGTGLPVQICARDELSSETPSE
jgi:LysR family transcriptional regulator, hydrogen peroxide-inducible genes activator